MDKSAAQMVVERLLGEAQAGKAHQRLMEGGMVTLPINKVPCKIHWVHPLLKTSDPKIRVVEARTTGGEAGVQWADGPEFVWAALAMVLIDNPHRISAGPNCISIFASPKIPRVLTKTRRP